MDRINELGYVLVKMCVLDAQRLDPSQAGEIFREIFDAGHRRASY
jgi:hypothetical protein